MSVKVLGWVFEHSEVAHRGDLLVLLVLADHAHDDGAGAYPGVETIARKARLTRRGTQLALRRLEAEGAIEPVGRHGHGMIEYRVLLEANPVRSEVSSQRSESHIRGEVSDTGGRTPLRPNRKEPSVNRHTPPTPPRGMRRTSASRRLRPGFSYDEAVT